jgi:predicted acyltransferase (DUF342 family)
MTEIFFLVGAFAGLIALPFVPGIVEIRRPRDSTALSVVQDNTKEPRHFGMSLRERLQPFIAEVDELPSYREIQLRNRESLEVHENLQIPESGHTSSLLVARNRLEVGMGATISEAYGMGDVVVGSKARIRGLAVDGALTLGSDCKVERWIDAEGKIKAGEQCDLGVSASSSLSLSVAEGSKFQRLWGMPVTTSTSHSLDSPDSPYNEPSAADSLVWGRDLMSLPPKTRLSSGLVVDGDLFVGAGSLIKGDIKAHGSVILAAGVRVSGNVICRKSLIIGPRCTVSGNVFAERDIEIGPNSSVGRVDAYKTVYSARRISLGNKVKVFGWVVAEAGGRVV